MATDRPPASVPRRRAVLPALVLLAGLAAGASLHAAGSEPTPNDPPWLVEARKELVARRFDAAISVMGAASPNAAIATRLISTRRASETTMVPSLSYL